LATIFCFLIRSIRRLYFMDINALTALFLSPDSPVLPSPIAMRVVLHVGWAAVLGAGAWWLTGRLARFYRWGLGILLVAWALVPGNMSPTFWLGLAFQAPSLMTIALSLAWFTNQAQREATHSKPQQAARELRILAGLGVVLGWVLLLDTLALLPISVYSWGFSSAALGAVVILLILLFWGGYSKPQGHERGLKVLALPLGVLAVFVLTRLPTGNLWDALLDPWLWAVLQVGWVINAVRRWKIGRRLSRATPA
jgi:hypothetical protein